MLRSAFELKIPPPLVGLLCMAGMYYLAPLSLTTLSIFSLNVIGFVVCLVTGFVIAFSGVIRKVKTTVNPLQPEKSTALVTYGIYNFTRNPMYLGMAISILGFSLLLMSFVSLIGVLVFIGFIQRFQIKPEEQALSQHFGQSFTN